MNVCKKIVEVYGGDIQISSELNKGSKFSFTFGVKEYIFEKQENQNFDEDFAQEEKYQTPSMAYLN